MEPIDDNIIDYSKLLSDMMSKFSFDKDDDLIKRAEALVEDKEEEVELTSDPSFEKLKKLVGDIYALGLLIGKEKARFGSEEAYDEWVKGKPQADIINMLMEHVKKIMKLFEDNNKTIKKTVVKKTYPVKKKLPVSDPFSPYVDFDPNIYKKDYDYNKMWEKNGKWAEKISDNILKRNNII